MASAMIHICVAKRINEKLKRNEKMLFLGAIAPDISKQIGDAKEKSHFLNSKLPSGVPDIDAFIKKYSSELNQDFTLGYLIHLYTDKFWYDGFINQFIKKGNVKLLDGTNVKLDSKTIQKMIYEDYTNINVQLIDSYHLDLSLFYEPVIYPNTQIEEIPINKLQILVDKMGIIIENSKEDKSYIFDITQVKEFIDKISIMIYNELLKHKIIEK